VTEDLYELLGVERDAKPSIIKAAYRRLAAVHHPDKGGDQEMFVAVTTAYNVLMDPKLREMYDLTGSTGGENPVAVQHRVIESLAHMFELVLSRNKDVIEETDIIEQMEFETGRVKEVNLQRRAEIMLALKSFNRVVGRIKRKGEEKNVFAEIAEKRIKELSDELEHVGKILSDIERMLEIMADHESVVDMIRTVQMGAYFGDNRTAASGANFGQWILKFS
jgi:hypothetical protein